MPTAGVSMSVMLYALTHEAADGVATHDTGCNRGLLSVSSGPPEAHLSS